MSRCFFGPRKKSVSGIRALPAAFLEIVFSEIRGRSGVMFWCRFHVNTDRLWNYADGLRRDEDIARGMEAFTLREKVFIDDRGGRFRFNVSSVI